VEFDSGLKGKITRRQGSLMAKQETYLLSRKKTSYGKYTT
jgi:hypothetical protein